MRSFRSSLRAAATTWARRSVWSASEAGEVSKRQFPVMDVHGAELGAAGEGRDGLARIEQAQRVEGVLQGEEGLELGRTELHAHLVDLLAADPVLAGDRAADRDAELQDRPA